MWSAQQEVLPDVVAPMSAFYGIASVAGLAISALVFFARPGRLQNRLLALALLFEVFASVRMAAFHGLPHAQFGPGLDHALGTVLWFAGWGISTAYLAFLGTVDTRWSRPLGSRRARLGLIGVLAATWILRLAIPDLTDVTWVNFLVAGVSLYGLLIAISYWRTAEPGTLLRRQATAYAAAFGARDVMFVLFGAFTIWTILGGGFIMLFEHPLHLWFPGIAQLLFAPLVAYGILTTQLFDIDLKLKWTLEKSTVAAIFVAVFFVVSEGAQVLFAGFAGNEILGVLAAGALVFFLAPLQRFADRVGDRVMPGVEDTEAYREQRKREVYRATVEELMDDDEITAKERRMLGRLQEELGLEGGEASRIEAEVVEGGGEAA